MIISCGHCVQCSGACFFLTLLCRVLQAQPQAVRQAAQLFAAAAVSLLATASAPQAMLAAVSEPAQESGVQRVERAREQVEYKLGLQQQVKRAEEIARRAQLERVVEGVQARLDLKLTEERANLQAAKVRSLPRPVLYVHVDALALTSILASRKRLRLNVPTLCN